MKKTCVYASGCTDLLVNTNWQAKLLAHQSGIGTMEVNQYELERPCHVSRSVLEQSRDDCIIYMPPGNVSQAL